MGGVWMALDPAGADNGCMHICPLSQLESKEIDLTPIPHFMRRDWQICDTQVITKKLQPIAIPLKPGGMLFFTSLVPHGTPPNLTHKPRQAIQAHFAPKGYKNILITQEERKEIFGDHGGLVQC